MNWLERIGAGLRAFDDPAKPINEATASGFFQDLMGDVTYTGKRVSVRSSLETQVTVFACVRLIAETFGSFPAHLFRRTSDRERERVEQTKTRYPGSLARLIHQSPNIEMTASEFWELRTGHVASWGDAWAEIVRDGMGRPSALWPLRPDRMEVKRSKAGRRQFLYTLDSGERVELLPRQVFHTRGFGLDPLVGLSPIGVARQAVSVALATEEYGGRLFANSAIPGVVVKSPNRMKAQEVKEFKANWTQKFGGLSNAQRVAVLHSGMEVETLGIPPKDAQFLDLRKFEVAELARLFRVPLHMIQEVEKSTSWGSGIEQQDIGFAVHTMLPYVTRTEASINRDLRDPEAGNTLLDEALFAKFDMRGLLRGDMKTRAEFYSKGINDGWLLREDVRALEDLPVIAGLDKPVLSENVQVLDEEGMPIPDDSWDIEAGGRSSRRAREKAWREGLDRLTPTAPSNRD